MLTTLRRWAPALAIVATAAVVALSLGNQPQLGTDLLNFVGADKVKHAFAYATLGVLWGAWLCVKPHVAPRALWLGLFALGASLEVLQWRFYPERFFEFADMLANGAGAALGLLIIRRIFPSP